MWSSAVSHGVKSIYINNLEAEVEGNKTVEYRINAKATFVPD